MMYLVEKTFKDRETKELHEKGTIFVSDNEERIEELKQGGFLGVELVVREEVEAPEEKVEGEGKEIPEELFKEEVKGKKKGDK